MSDQSNLCTRCGADNLRDGYFCVNCKADMEPVKKLADLGALLGIYDTSTLADVGVFLGSTRLPLPQGDDDGERFIPATADELAAAVERIEGSGEITW